MPLRTNRYRKKGIDITARFSGRQKNTKLNMAVAGLKKICEVIVGPSKPVAE